MSGNNSIDLQGNSSGITYAGRPLTPIRDLDNSIFLGVQTGDLFMSWRRQMKVDLLGKTDDSDKWLITMAFGIGADNPKHFWKITGYSAT